MFKTDSVLDVAYELVLMVVLGIVLHRNFEWWEIAFFAVLYLHWLNVRAIGIMKRRKQQRLSQEALCTLDEIVDTLHHRVVALEIKFERNNAKF